MKLKRFIAPTMRQAISLIEEELGADAVIMSNRTTSSGGVEVVAAIDPDATPKSFDIKDNEDNKKFKDNSHIQSNTRKVTKPRAKAKATYESVENNTNSLDNFTQTQEMQRMSQEIKAVRSLLEEQLSGIAWGQQEKVFPEKIALIKRLVRLGIGWGLAQNLVEQVDSKKETAWNDILQHIAQSINHESCDIVDKGGVIALVGPTGVGKTTTIAKMASRFVMRNSASQIALITTDCYKIGAQAQLKTFAEIIDVPVHVAKSESELYSLLASLATKKLILIDTAGIGQKNIQLSEQFTKQSNLEKNIKNYLVVSAATQLSVLNDIVNSFSKIGLQGCILTKLDEAIQLGNMITLLIEHQLSLAFVSNGQRVPEDLETVRITEFIDKAIVLGQQKMNTDMEDKVFRLGMGQDVSNAK